MARKAKEKEDTKSEVAASSLERILKQKKYEQTRSAVVSAADIVKYTDKISTGSLMLDLYLDGGYRCGISRFIGEPEHGKTANALAWGKHWQSTVPKGVVVYVNAEGRITMDLLKRSGIDQDPSKLYIVNSNIYETVAQIIYDAVTYNDEETRYFFIIDSTDALISIDDEKKQFTESATIAGGARMASAFTKKTCLNIASRGHHLMILSQTRANLAAKAGPGSGGTTESGGKALAFYSSLTGKIDKMSDFNSSYIYPQEEEEDNKNDDKKKDKPVPIGNYFSVTFVKSFHEKSRQKVKVPIKYGVGVWREMEIFDLCLMYGIIEKNKAWYKLDEEMAKLVPGVLANFQGKNTFIQALESNPAAVEAFTKYFKETLMGHDVGKAVPDSESEDEV